MGVEIEFTRNSETRTLDFSTPGGTHAAIGLREMRSQPINNRNTQFTVGNQAISVNHGAHDEITVRFSPIKMNTIGGTFLGDLWSFIAHAQAGGEFSFAYDSAKKFNEAVLFTAGSNVVTGVSDTSSIAANDVMLFFNDNDRSTWEKRSIFEVITPNTSVRTNGELTFTQDGGQMRHDDFWPQCVLSDSGVAMLAERAGGRGAFIRDFGFKFRSVGML